MYSCTAMWTFVSKIKVQKRKEKGKSKKVNSFLTAGLLHLGQ